MQYYWLNKKQNCSSKKGMIAHCHSEQEILACIVGEDTSHTRQDALVVRADALRMTKCEESSKKLIIFFCGWSFDNKPFERLDCGDYDVLMFYDYKDHMLPLEIPVYDEYYLVSWSMGVYIAYLLREKLPAFKEKVAINGTPFPIHNEWGIPLRTFDLTLKYVDTGLEGKFQRNLFKEEADFKKYLENPVARRIPEQAQELVDLKNFILQSDIYYEKFYDRAIISDTDKIIPTKNQIDFWKDKVSIVMLNSGHFPFYSFRSWEEILKCS